MRFLNVYPKRLFATLNEEGVFEGQFTFNLEQYGLLLSDTVCDVKVFEDPIMVGQWKIWVKPMFDVDMPHFNQFVDTLNFYVFENLRYTPNRSRVGDELPVVKIFFDDIYFDLSGLEPHIQKISKMPLKK